MSVQNDDRVIEIGSGTGKLINKMTKKIDKGLIEGKEKGELNFSLRCC